MRHRTAAAPRGDVAGTDTDVVVRSSPIHGVGVFAGRGFRQGELILQPDESHVVKDEDALPEDERKYCYDLPGKSVLWPPPERYINHSCEPRACIKTVGDVRVVLAMRDIEPDEEITLDYRMD